MDYTTEQLNGLIAEVEKEFKVHLAKAEESFVLAKSEDMPKKYESKEKDEKKAADESKGESKKPMEKEKPEDKGVKDQHQQDMSEDKKGEPMKSKEGREEEDKKENAKPSEDPHGEAQDHGYDDEDMEHMHSMYSSMSKGELKAHHDCIRKCMGSMDSGMGMAKGEMEDGAKDAEGYRPNGGPKDGKAETEGKGPASSDAQAMTKSEKNVSIDEISLLKSELESVKTKSAEEKKSLEAALQTFLTKFVDKVVPAGKAITSLDIIAKTEGGNSQKPLTKNEIDAKLLAKSKDNSTSKSDRDAINSYYFSKNVESIRHLL